MSNVISSNSSQQNVGTFAERRKFWQRPFTVFYLLKSIIMMGGYVVSALIQDEPSSLFLIAGVASFVLSFIVNYLEKNELIG